MGFWSTNSMCLIALMSPVSELKSPGASQTSPSILFIAGYRMLDKRRFARAAYPGDHCHDVERYGGVHPAQVVHACTVNLYAHVPFAPSVRQRYRLFAADVFYGVAQRVSGHGILVDVCGIAGEDYLAAELPASGPTSIR